MKIGDLVTIITGCTECGEVPAIIIDIVHDRAFVETLGELKHESKKRSAWIDINRLRVKDGDI
jgi:hypothetical protein